MDQQTLYAIEARCTQEAPPRCRTACPFGLDVRAFLEKLEAGKPVEARKILERHVPLPELMAHICDHPCETACVRRDFGGGLAVNALERFCVHETRPAKGLPRPPRAGTISILGNGLAALVAASDLAQKGYGVTLFHEAEPESTVRHRFGGLERFVLALPALVSFVQVADVAFPEPSSLDGFVFVDADACPDLAPERKNVDTDTLLSNSVCYGGWLDRSPTGHMYASASQQGADGRRAALTLQRLLEGVSLTAAREQADIPGETRLHVQIDGIMPEPRIVPETGAFSAEESVKEASRCIRCSCMACVKECVFLKKYKSFPRAYARQIYNNMSIVKGQHLANRLINACTLCGQCTEICPERFSMAELCLAARENMVDHAAMPPSAFAFALQDMAEASSAAAFMVGEPESPAKDCLFPGCQLPASRPDQTARLYELLRPLWQDKGCLSLWQTCCGVPAHWAGDRHLFAKHCDDLHTQWEHLGRPRLLMACASCLKTFREALPDIPVVGLWEVLDAVLPESVSLDGAPDLPSHLTIHDPCAARHDAAWQNAVRSLARKHGLTVLEPRLTGTTTACCGYGGGVWNAQPDMAEAMSSQRAEALVKTSEKRDGLATGAGGVLVSCSMCRDRLAKSVPAWHILDALIAPVAAEQGGIPGLSARRANRMSFRVGMLGETPTAADVSAGSSLHIAPDVLAALERRFILRSDMETAVAGVESTGAYFVERDSGHRVGSWCPGNVTFWVRYGVDAAGRTLHDGWCHRMRVPGASQPQGAWTVQPRRLDKA